MVLYEGESNENVKSAINNMYKYLRFSFDSPFYSIEEHYLRNKERVKIFHNCFEIHCSGGSYIA